MGNSCSSVHIALTGTTLEAIKGIVRAYTTLGFERAKTASPEGGKHVILLRKEGDAFLSVYDSDNHPEDADLLGPLVVDEILIRLLRAPIGNRIAQIGHTRSGVQRIAEAVTWIRPHFAQPVTVEEMAASAHMSASSFHQRFKAVTTMSPLQHQKVLRLHEARRLMLFQNMDASDACHRVGYLSASQFSREYSRFFENAPSKDIARLREEGLGRSDGDR